MVFVKVREVYDLHTVQNKMTVIGIHTPRPDIIKANFPGLLMQCKAYRPYSCDVRVACASRQELDPLHVGVDTGDIAPEDLFNPILYKAISNVGMSQIEARIAFASQAQTPGQGQDVLGPSAMVEVNDLTNLQDEFPIYYGLLSNAHGWKTADPQAGLHMEGLRPFVYEMMYNIGDNQGSAGSSPGNTGYPTASGGAGSMPALGIRGNAKPLPMINCTSFSTGTQVNPFATGDGTDLPGIQEKDVPWINCVVGCIIVPPSRLHELFYRMVVEWTIEFSQVRPIGEITNWTGLGKLADITRYQNYSFEATKQALGVETEIMDNSQAMVDANVEIKKVM